MAKIFDLNTLNDEDVFITPSISEKDYAYSLLNTSNFNDDQKDTFDNELSDDGLSMNRFNDIVNELKMNQADSPNPGLKEIQQQLDERLSRDKD